MATSAAVWWAPDAGLGRGVAAHRRVPVEVVLGEVQPRAGDRPERIRPGQPEARALDHEHVDVEVERAHQRHLGVAGGDRSPARRLDHRRRQQRGGGLAVGPGDGDDRPRAAGPLLLPLVGEVDLAAHRHAGLPRDGEEAVALGHAGAGGHELDALHQGPQLGRRRARRGGRRRARADRSAASAAGGRRPRPPPSRGARGPAPVASPATASPYTRARRPISARPSARLHQRSPAAFSQSA